MGKSRVDKIRIGPEKMAHFYLCTLYTKFSFTPFLYQDHKTFNRSENLRTSAMFWCKKWVIYTKFETPRSIKITGPQLSISIKSFSDWPLVWKLWSKKHDICLVVFRFSALSLGFIFWGGLTRLTIISEKGVIAQTSWQFWKAEYLSLPEV